MLHIFTVWDSKVEAFMTPFFMRSKGEAIRAFSATVNDSNHAFSKHPADYALFYLGTFSDDTSAFTTVLPPVSLGLAIEFVSGVSSDPRQLAMEAIGLRNSDAVIE